MLGVELVSYVIPDLCQYSTLTVPFWTIYITHRVISIVQWTLNHLNRWIFQSWQKRRLICPSLNSLSFFCLKTESLAHAESSLSFSCLRQQTCPSSPRFPLCRFRNQEVSRWVKWVMFELIQSDLEISATIRSSVNTRRTCSFWEHVHKG